MSNSNKWTWTIQKYDTPQGQQMELPKEEWIFTCKDKPSDKQQN